MYTPVGDIYMYARGGGGGEGRGGAVRAGWGGGCSFFVDTQAKATGPKAQRARDTHRACIDPPAVAPYARRRSAPLACRAAPPPPRASARSVPEAQTTASPGLRVRGQALRQPSLVSQSDDHSLVILS